MTEQARKRTTNERVVSLTQDQALGMIRDQTMGAEIRGKIKDAYKLTKKRGWSFVILHLPKDDAARVRMQAQKDSYA